MATGYPSSAQARARDVTFEEDPNTSRLLRTQCSTSNERSDSWLQLPTSSSPAREGDVERDISNYPSSAAEMRDILLLKIAILSGGRDKQGQSLLTFPAKSKTFNFERADIRRTVQYLATIPLAEVRENGFSVIIEARGLQWPTVKLILRTLQEALPAQIHATYILCPAPFMQKRQILAGINKEKSKLEFTPLAVSSMDKLTQHVDQRQLTFDLGGTLPYNHEEWILLRLNLEHFVASYNALMEHTSHLEQQMLIEQSPSSMEEVEELLKRHEELSDQLHKTPKSTLREANDLLSSIQQQHGEAGASGLTPDKINAMALIRRLMDNTQQRQEQLHDIWRRKKTMMEQNLQLKLFDKGASKVRNWLKGKVEELQSVEIGSNLATVVLLEENQRKLEIKAQNVHSDLTQLRRMVDGMAGSVHYATETVRRQIAKLNSRYSKFEILLEKRKQLVNQSVRLHSAVDKWNSHFDECILEWKRESVPHSLRETDQLLCDVQEQLEQLHGLVESLDREAKPLVDMLQCTNGSNESRHAIRHVGRMMDEVVEKKRKAEQQAGAKRAKLEQYKQLYQCERDARQASDWLEAMCEEMVIVRGSIGNSVDSAKTLLAEQAKFMEKAKSTHKYCSELLNSAEAQRQMLKLELETNLSVHIYIDQVWESLRSALAEEETRLIRSWDLHKMLEHVSQTLLHWLHPVKDLHRNPASVTLLVKEIKDGRENMMQDLSRCYNAASSLLERLCHPLLEDATNVELNEPTRMAVGYLQGHVEWLAEKRRTLPTSINQQLQSLDVYSRQLAHEQYIEEVLMWLQDIGLPTMTSFCSLGSSLPTLSSQCAEFEAFDETCSGMDEHVGKIQAEVESLGAVHPEGSENILKKVGNLRRVWDRFLTRVNNRRQALTTTTKFFQDCTSVYTVFSELVSVLSGPAGSLSGDQSQELAETLPCYHQVMMDGAKLAGFLKQCPPDTKDMFVANKVLEKMTDLMSLFEHLSSLTAINGQQQMEAARETSQQEATCTESSGSHDDSTTQKISTTPIAEKTTPITEKTTPIESTVVKDTPTTVKHVPKVVKATPTVVETAPTTVKTTAVEGSIHPTAAAVSNGFSQQGSTSSILPTSSLPDKKSHVGNEEETLKKIEAESQKLLDFLNKEIESFLMIYSSVPTAQEKIGKVLSEHQNFQEKIQPTVTALSQMSDSVSSLSSISLRNRGELLSRRIMGRKREMEKQINERIELFKHLLKLCHVLREIKSKLQKLQEFLGAEVEVDTSEELAQQMLEEKSSLFQQLGQLLKEARTMSDDLLSKMYSVSKLDLSAMDARRFVRQEMRTFEGKMKTLSPQWHKREKFLQALCKWQSFLESHERLMVWLKNVGEPFLSSSWKLGTSHSTSEDLLNEIEEFRKKAEKIVLEITALLNTAAGIMVAQDFRPEEVKEKVQVLKRASDQFQLLLTHRHKAVSLAVEFFKEAEGLSQAIDITAEMLPVSSGTNGVLNPISVVTQLSFLQKRQKQLSLLAQHTFESIEETSHLSIDKTDLQESQNAMQTIVEDLSCKLEQYQLAQEDSTISSEQMSLSQRELEELEGLLLDIENHVEHELREQASQPPATSAAHGTKTGTPSVSNRRSLSSQLLLPKQDSVQNIKQMFEMLPGSSLPTSPTTPSSSLSDSARISTYPPRKHRSSVQDVASPQNITQESRTSSVPVITQAKIKTISSSHPISMVTIVASKQQLHAQSQPHTQSQLHAQPQSPAQSDSESQAKPLPYFQRDLSPLLSPVRAVVPSVPHRIPSYSKMQGTGKVSQLRGIFESGSTEQVPVSPTHHRIVCAERVQPNAPVRMEVHKLGPVSSDKGAIVTCEAPSRLTPVQVTIVELEKGRIDTPPPKRPPTPAHLKDGKEPPPIPPPIPPPPEESENSGREDEKDSEVEPTAVVKGEVENCTSQEEDDSNSSWDSESSHNSEELEQVEKESVSQLNSTITLTPVQEEEEEVLTSESGQGEDQPDVGLPWRRSKKAKEHSEDTQWKKRSLKSLRSVMRGLVVSEDHYLGALYRMVKGYRPLFDSEELPTFLEGKEEVIFSNAADLFEFHLFFQDQLKTRKDSVEGICSCFTENRQRFLCYLKYIRDFEQGQQILVAYGGSFLTDFQQVNGWDTNLQQDHQHPYERLNHYRELLQDLLACAQKEYLHGVNHIKEAEDVVRSVLMRADVELGVQKLRGCPFKVNHELVLLHGEFFVTVGKKKTMSVYHAFLHEHYLILTDLQFSAEAECVLFYYVDCMQTAGMKLIENYNNLKERFAVFSGQTEDMLVFKPCSDDPLMKDEWVAEIKKILQRKAEEAMPHHTLQPDQLERLTVGPDTQSVPVPVEGELKRSGSLKRKSSFKGQDTVHKKEGTSLQERSSHKSSKKHVVDPTATANLPSTVLAGVHQPTEEELELQQKMMYMYVVISEFSSDREGHVSVSPGDLVEVLEEEGNYWLVCTIPSEEGELEKEGLVPANCLLPVTQGDGTILLPEISSNYNNNNCDSLPQASAAGGHSELVTTLQESVPGEAGKQKHTTATVSTGLLTMASETPANTFLLAKPEIDPCLSPSDSQPSKEEVACEDLSDAMTSVDEEKESSSKTEKRSLLPPRNSPNFFFNENMSLEAALMMTHSEQEGSQLMDANMRDICRIVSARRPQPSGSEDTLKSSSDTVVHKDAGQQSNVENVPLSRWSIPSLETSMVPLLEETAGVGVGQANGKELFDSMPNPHQGSRWYSAHPRQSRYSSSEEEEEDDDSGEENEDDDEDNFLNQIPLDYNNYPLSHSYNKSFPLERDSLSNAVTSNRRVLYAATFLNRDCFSDTEPPTRAQLEGVFSLRHPYVAVTEYKATEPTQLSLSKGQLVTVIDSKRGDWWLCQTISDGSLPSVVGWVSRAILQHAEYIREEQASYGGSHLSPSPPPSSSLWVVLADYQAHEEGTLSVRTGELVEVIDNSRNKWSLVRTTDRQTQEGWIPTGYIRPYEFMEVLAVPNVDRPMSAGSSTEQFDPINICASPEFVLEDDKEWFEDGERRKEAATLREYTFLELLSSELEYVERLTFCVSQYMLSITTSNSSTYKTLRGVAEQLFGNLEDILNYHQKEMIPQLEKCRGNMSAVGEVFTLAAPNLKSLYVTYCRGKSRSDDIYQDHLEQLQELGESLKDRLTLRDYLILPVQRITKYNLLLKNFLKYSVRAGIAIPNFQSALEVTHSVSTCANNAVHLSMIEGIQRRLDEFGELILQDVFGISEPQQRGVFKERRIFLFEQSLMMTKRRKDNTDRESYIIKELLLLPEVSITEDVDSDKRNIILYDMVTGNKFTLKASHGKLRDAWITQANNCIVKAKRSLSLSMPRSRSESDPANATPRSVTTSGSLSLLGQGSQRPRTSTRSRPSSASGARLQPVEPKPGTLYVVMQCIVMVGGDEIQLERGEVVELVKVETSGDYRVRTTDENQIEGVVSPSFLRNQDAVRGQSMETAPKIIFPPSNMSLMLGQAAKVSCVFNGHPDPDVVWKKDGEPVLSSNRVKISLCSTSSVMEISQLHHADDGEYCCCVNNTIGSDIAEFSLFVEGAPSPPGKPYASKITTVSAKIRWAVPEYSGHSPISSFQLELLQEGFEEWQPIVQHSKNSFHVKTLEPGTSYQFRVVAYNKDGPSDPSEPSDKICTAPGKSKGRQPSSPMYSKRRREVEIVIEDFDASNGDLNGFTSPTFKPPTESSGDGYELLPEELGRGRFGITYKCLHRQTNKEFAAKYLFLTADREPSDITEAEVLQLVSGTCQHVQQYVDTLVTPSNIVIITELILGEGLLDHIVQEHNLTEMKIAVYLQQLLLALEHIHLLSIVHLDIKPENIILTHGSPALLKLIDFGSAVDLSVTSSVVASSGLVSSPEFTAPEILSNEELTTAADIWSVGILCYILFCGISPFFDENPKVMQRKVCETRVEFPHDLFGLVSPEARDLVKSLLQKASRYRPSANEVLQHKLIKTVGMHAPTKPLPVIARLKVLSARRKMQTSSVAVDAGKMFGSHSSTDPLSPFFSDEQVDGVPSQPKLWNGPEIIRVVLRDPAVIQWVLGGLPTPSVSWEHNETKLLQSRRITLRTEGGVTSLSITDVARSDEGIYTCCAVNSFGTDIKETRLLVMDRPSAPSSVTGVTLGEYNSLLVSWLPPVSNGNSHITHYVLEQRRLDCDQWELVDDQIPSAAHVVDKLLPGVSYVFRVTAVNGIGRSATSKPSIPLTVSVDKGDPRYENHVHLKETDFAVEYELGEMISRTSHVSVYECTEMVTNRMFIAKVFTMVSERDKKVALGEYEILRQLNHPHLVAMEDAFSDQSHLTIVQEYCAGGDLRSFVSYGPLEESMTVRFTRQIAEGLQYLHECGIIHANISPSNILLTARHQDLKIGNFSLARSAAKPSEVACVPKPIDYNAPEVLSQQLFTPACDVWSMGAVALFMLTSEDPFLSSSREETTANVLTCQVAPRCSRRLSELSKDCTDFLMNGILIMSPLQRLTASQCQRHRWLQSFSSQCSHLPTAEEMEYLTHKYRSQLQRKIL